jgi:hypothetical protein
VVDTNGLSSRHYPLELNEGPWCSCIVQEDLLELSYWLNVNVQGVPLTCHIDLPNGCSGLKTEPQFTEVAIPLHQLTFFFCLVLFFRNFLILVKWKFLSWTLALHSMDGHSELTKTSSGWLVAKNNPCAQFIEFI